MTKKEKPNIWVTQTEDHRWQKKHENSQRASGTFDTQSEAIESANDQAEREGVEVIVQNRHGKIRSKDSFGKDPSNIKDTEH